MKQSSKKINQPAEVVTLETSADVFEVRRRLDAFLHREKGGLEAIARATANPEGKDAETLVRDLRVASDGGPVIFFSDYRYDEWMSAYAGRRYPVTFHYVFGNHVVAESLMRHDILATLNVPPRIIITEREAGPGARLVFYLPSSVIAHDGNPELRKAAEFLDGRLLEVFQMLDLPDPE